MRRLGLALLMVACSTQEAVVLESTTKEVPVSGGMARSADGLFEVVVPVEGLAAAAVIEIETLGIAGPARSLSRVYEVRISDLALRPTATLTARYHATAIDFPRALAIARWPSGGEPLPLSGNEALAPNTVDGQVSPFSRERFCVVPAPLPPPPAIPDGWSTPAGTATSAWVIDDLAIAGQGSGFNLNSQCDADGCLDNALWRLGALANDQIRLGILGGETLLGLELAGLDQPYRGDDPSLTVKFYGLKDLDDPFFPANNFEVPVGQTECCQFLIPPEALSGSEARSRSPAQIDRGRLSSVVPVSMQFLLTVGVPPHPELRFEQTRLGADLPQDARSLSGLLGGVLPISTLGQTENPYCRTVGPLCPIQFADSTLLDLVSTMFGPPDVDLDGDGLECVKDRDGDGRVDLCCDGVVGQNCAAIGASCPGVEVVSPDSTPGEEWKCALQPEMADGYSIALEFSAVPATFFLSR